MADPDPSQPPRGSGMPPKKVAEFTLGETIGEGSFTKVRLGTNGSRKVAVRTFDKNRLTSDPDDLKVLAREKAIVPLLDHPNIARVHEVLETTSAVHFIMEYCPDGDLLDFIQEKGILTEPEARRIFRQLVSSVAYIHRASIVHRDLKPDNVLLRGSVVKLIDFGFCNLTRRGHLMTTGCGTAAYAAPEILAGHHYVGKPVDIWSLGVILYVLVTGSLPFSSESDPEAVLGVIKESKNNCPPDLPPDLSPALVELLRGMLTVDPDYRYTLESILNNTWFRVDAAEDPENTTLWKMPSQELKDAIKDLHSREMLMNSMNAGSRPLSLRSSRSRSSATSTRSSTPPRRGAVSGHESRAKRSSVRSRNSRNSLGGISEDLAGEKRAGPIGRPSSENMSHVMPHLRTLNGSASFTSLPGLARADDDSLSASSGTPSAGSRSSILTSSSAGSSGSAVSGPSVPAVPLGAQRRGSTSSNGTTRLLPSTGLRSHVPPQPSKLARESSGKYLHTLRSPDAAGGGQDAQSSPSAAASSSFPSSPASPASPLPSPTPLPPTHPPARATLRDKAPPPPRPSAGTPVTRGPVPGSPPTSSSTSPSKHSPSSRATSSLTNTNTTTTTPSPRRAGQVPPIPAGTVQNAVKFFDQMPNGGVAGIGAPPAPKKTASPRGIRGPLKALVGRHS